MHKVIELIWKCLVYLARGDTTSLSAIYDSFVYAPKHIVQFSVCCCPAISLCSAGAYVHIQLVTIHVWSWIPWASLNLGLGFLMSLQTLGSETLSARELIGRLNDAVQQRWVLDDTFLVRIWKKLWSASDLTDQFGISIWLCHKHGFTGDRLRAISSPCTMVSVSHLSWDGAILTW